MLPEIGRHGGAPQERVLDDEVAVVDDAVVETFEGENRLLKNFHHRNAAHIFHRLGTHLLLRIEIHPLEIVVVGVHHIAHDAKGADHRHHGGQSQLPVYHEEEKDDAERSDDASCHIG